MEQARENEILRNLIKLVLMQKGVRLLPQNEFNRELTSIAEKLGVEVEELRLIVVPMLEEIFSEMIHPLSLGGKKSSHARSIPGSAFTG